jgi:hypothetical protein
MKPVYDGPVPMKHALTLNLAPGAYLGQHIDAALLPNGQFFCCGNALES